MTPPLDRQAIGQIESAFALTFTPYEVHILRDTNLDPYEAQHRTLLHVALNPCQCPACGRIICQRSAAGMTLITTPATVRPDDGYACPACQTPLTWHLAITGGQHFTVTADAAKLAALDDAERRLLRAAVTVQAPNGGTLTFILDREYTVRFTEPGKPARVLRGRFMRSHRAAASPPQIVFDVDPAGQSPARTETISPAWVTAAHQVAADPGLRHPARAGDGPAPS
jgi:hypothetical protein